MDLYAIVLLIIVACMPFGAVAQETCSKEASNKEIIGEMMILLSTLNNKVFDQGDLIQALSEKSLAQAAEIDSLKTEDAELRERGLAQAAEIDSLKTENAEFRERGLAQAAEIDSLKTEDAEFRERDLQQETEISNQAAAISGLESNMAALTERGTTQAADIERLTTEIADLKEEVEEPVAFTAYASNLQTIDSGNKVRFNKARFNHGGHYDPQSSIFTCPITGIFVFSLSVVSQAGEQVMAYVTKNNGDKIAHVFADDNDDESNEITRHESASSNICITNCNAGERVWVVSLHISKLHGHPTEMYTSFSGFLINRL